MTSPGKAGMTFIERWLAAVIAVFLLFPVAFVLRHGPDADFGDLGA
jgi:hypothetical protein